jgi:subtilase family serine protease
MRVGRARRVAPLALALAAAAWLLAASFAAADNRSGAVPKFPLPHPTVSDYEQVSTSETPPTQTQCSSTGRRCFAPQAIRASYNLLPLYAGGNDGRGRTIAIVDSYGSDTMAHDLHVFNQAFGLAPMCGEEGVTCAPGMPTFSDLSLQGSPATKAPPSTSHGTGQENKSAWALEVALDVETSHAIAPGANILLVHTPTAETLGVQGFPQMMAAEKYVVDNHLADLAAANG